MNFKNLLESQEKLDETIFSKFEVSRENTQKKRLLAFKVELSELANEIKFFKYWKENICIDKERILEESSDCLHFLLSLSVDYKVLYPKKGRNYLSYIHSCFNLFKMSNPKYKYHHLEKIFLSTYELSTEIDKFHLIVKNFIDICILIGVTKEELINAYYNKNEINYKRVFSNY